MPPRKVAGRGAPTAAPETFEAALEAAAYQEQQGERYIFGDKAQRHYAEARRLLEGALQLRAGDAEAAHRLGSVLFTLATVFESAPTCVATLRAAADAQRAALAAETTDDAAFNLGQTLSALAQMLADGAAGDPGGALPAMREAAEVWTTTEHLQHALLNQAALPAELSEGSDGSGEAMEPATIVETLLEHVDVLASLYAATSAGDERAAVWQTLEAALQRAEALDAQDGHASAAAIGRAQALATIARVEADCADGAPPNVTALLSAVDTLERVLAADVGTSERPPSLDVATELADAHAVAADLLLRFAAAVPDADRDEVRAAGLAQLKAAYDAYDAVVARLAASPLHADHGVPAHLVPSTLSAAHAARSRLLLLLSLSSPTLLDGALETAVRAVECCGAGLTYRAAERAFAKSPGAARTDWTTAFALRTAALCLARAGFADLGTVARLLLLSGATPAHVREHVDGLVGDAVWLASDGAERTMWERLAAALEAECAVAGATSAEVPGR